jgi:hypothetical protein
MAKYKFIEDYTLQYNPSMIGMNNIVAAEAKSIVFKKGETIEGRDIDGSGKTISTTFSRTMPDGNVFGQQWIAIPIEKLKEIKPIPKTSLTVLRVVGVLITIAAVYGTLKFTKIIK